MRYVKRERTDPDGFSYGIVRSLPDGKFVDYWFEGQAVRDELFEELSALPGREVELCQICSEPVLWIIPLLTFVCPQGHRNGTARLAIV